MTPKEKEEEIERIAGEVLNNMSVATALSILIEKSKEIAKNYMDTASTEKPPNETNNLPETKRGSGFLSKKKNIFK